MTFYFMLFWMFFQIGLFGFGGGYAILPLIFQNIQQFGIMSKAEFANLAAIAQITPGPIALNAATYVGFNSAGLPGALVATLGITLPSLILITVIAHFLDKFKNSRAIGAAMSGIRPATIGLIAAAVIFVGESSLFNGTPDIKTISQMGLSFFNLVPIIIFLCCIVSNAKWKVHPLILIAAGGIAGIFLL